LQHRCKLKCSSNSFKVWSLNCIAIHLCHLFQGPQVSSTKNNSAYKKDKRYTKYSCTQTRTNLYPGFWEWYSHKTACWAEKNIQLSKGYLTTAGHVKTFSPLIVSTEGSMNAHCFARGIIEDTEVKQRHHTLIFEWKTNVNSVSWQLWKPFTYWHNKNKQLNLLSLLINWEFYTSYKENIHEGQWTYSLYHIHLARSKYYPDISADL
jgi:hypothetical protein